MHLKCQCLATRENKWPSLVETKCNIFDMSSSYPYYHTVYEDNKGNSEHPPTPSTSTCVLGHCLEMHGHRVLFIAKTFPGKK